MRKRKSLLCIALSLIMVVSAIYAAYQKPKEVKAAVVIDDAMAIISLLAACGMVYTGVTWWQDGSAAENLDDLYGDEIGEIKEGKLVSIFQECMENLNISGGDDFNPEEDDPNDKVPSFDKLIQWIKLHPGETIMTTGTALAAVLLKFANALKDEADDVPKTYLSNSVTSYDAFLYNNFSLNYTGYYSGAQIYYNNAIISNYRGDSSLPEIYTAIFMSPYDKNGKSTMGYYIFSKDYFDLTLSTNDYPSGVTRYNSGLIKSQENSFYCTGGSGAIVSSLSSNSPIFITTDGIGGTSNHKVMHDILFNNGKEYLKVDLNSENVKYGSIVDFDENNDISTLPVPQINASALAQNWPQILPALQNQLALGLDPAEKVDEIINTVGTAPSKPPSIAPDIGESPELEPLPEIEEVDGLDKGSFLLPDWITEKFPFCVPFDIIRAFSVLESTSRTAPKITLPLKAERYGIDYELDIDLAVFDEVAVLLRSLELILFVIGLALVSRDLIKG